MPTLRPLGEQHYGLGSLVISILHRVAYEEQPDFYGQTVMGSAEIERP